MIPPPLLVLCFVAGLSTAVEDTWALPQKKKLWGQYWFQVAGSDAATGWGCSDDDTLKA